MNDNIVDIQNLDLYFDKNTNKEFYALKDINLQVKKGEFCILKGVSGSGKSTLLSLIAALIKPTKGKIEVCSFPISKMPDFHRSEFRQNYVGVIFQNFNLFENLSLLENMQIPLIPLKNKEANISELLKILNLEDKKNSFVKTLSGGEKQRLAIARALINDPDLILADEPTANLDKKNSLILIDILKSLQEKGKTIIVSTHDDIFTQELKDIKLINIEDGKIK